MEGLPCLLRFPFALTDQYFEHQYMIKRRTTAPRSIGAGNRCFEIGSELPEIDEAFDALQIVAFGGQFPQTLFNVEEPRHPPHHVRFRDNGLNQGAADSATVFGGVQFLMRIRCFGLSDVDGAWTPPPKIARLLEIRYL